MGRPARIPTWGDVPASTVAQVLGLSLVDFESKRSELMNRNFPEPDPTTGLYAIEAVHRWRMRRYPKLFPELTVAPAAIHAENVFADRMRRLG